jgi:hypothetical protein
VTNVQLELVVVGLESCRLCQVHCEPLAGLAVAAGHLGGGMAELALYVSFVDGRRRGEARAQRMAREQRHTFGFGQIGAQACLHRAGFDQPRDLRIDQPVRPDIAVGLAYPPEHRASVDAGEFQPAFQCMDRAGGVRRAAPYFDEAPAGLAFDGEQRPRLEDLDPAE